jgi:hypothetical protein
MEVFRGVYLETDPAQVAQRSHERRHGCVVCSAVVMLVGCVADSRLTMPRTETTPYHNRASPVASLSLNSIDIETSGVGTASIVIKAFNMIIRSLLRAQAPKIAGRRTLRIPTRTFKTTRRYSTSNASMASSTPQSQASMLATITTDLDKIAPRFEIHPEQIEIIQTPAEFYETLKVGCYHSSTSLRSLRYLHHLSISLKMPFQLLQLSPRPRLYRVSCVTHLFNSQKALCQPLSLYRYCLSP